MPASTTSKSRAEQLGVAATIASRSCAEARRHLLVEEGEVAGDDPTFGFDTLSVAMLGS